MKRIFGITSAILLSACQQSAQYKYVQIDGHALTNQYEADRAICEGEAQKAEISGGQIRGSLGDILIDGIHRDQSVQAVRVGCMAQKGYAWTKTDQTIANR